MSAWSNSQPPFDGTHSTMGGVMGPRMSSGKAPAASIFWNEEIQPSIPRVPILDEHGFLCSTVGLGQSRSRQVSKDSQQKAFHTERSELLAQLSAPPRRHRAPPAFHKLPAQRRTYNRIASLRPQRSTSDITGFCTTVFGFAYCFTGVI